MEKIQELVKEGKLAKELMADKEFVEGAKEIFKSEKIEIDDKKLAELMNNIEARLKKSNILDDKALEEVSGGITRKGVASGVIKTVTSAMGVSFGAVAASATTKALVEGVPQNIGGGDVGSVAGGILAVGVGVTAGLPAVAAGATGGGYLGYKIGKWICKKAGLEED